MRTVQNTCPKSTRSLSECRHWANIVKSTERFSFSSAYAQFTFLELRFPGKTSGQLSRKENFQALLAKLSETKLYICKGLLLSSTLIAEEISAII